MTLDVKATGTFSAVVGVGPDTARDARAFVDTLPVGLGAGERYDLRLGLAELAINSATHGRSGEPDDRIAVDVTVSSAAIRCEVTDNGPGFLPPPDRNGGFGLIIVDRIAARWGTRRGGNTAWFEIDRVTSASA